MTEAEFGEQWRKMAIEEGHRKKHPASPDDRMGCSAETIARRKQVKLLLDDGLTASQIAKKLGAQRQLIRHDAEVMRLPKWQKLVMI